MNSKPAENGVNFHFIYNDFMMKSNFLNLTNTELDKPVYRIFDPTRLFDIFDTGRMGLVKPQVWDDPFENYILNATGFLPDGKSFVIGDKDHLYCQCWSSKKESDAMWRIYSPKPDHTGIKVSSTPRKLLTALYVLKYSRFTGQPMN